MTGTIALHGGGEYVEGDEAAMDALFAAALAAAAADPTDVLARIVLVPTAAARQRPQAAARHGERAFAAAAERAGARVQVRVAPVLDRSDAQDEAVYGPLASAHLVHLPGGDPDLIPAVLRGTPAWAAILSALGAGGCVAGASAGAMALAERCWTPAGVVEGLGLLPGFAVLPHFAPRRLAAWRRSLDAGEGDRRLSWLGLDEQTLVIGRPGGEWHVAGRGRVHVLGPGEDAPRTAGAGETLSL